MPSFSYIVDTFCALALSVIAIACTLNWVDREQAADVELAQVPKRQIVLRWLFVVGVLWLICWASDVAIWVVLVVLAAGSAIPILLNPNAGFPPGGLIVAGLMQFVMGFPMRRDLFLIQPDRDLPVEPHGRVHAGLIGNQGVVSIPLKPLGKIEMEGTFYVARSDRGIFVGVDEQVVILRIEHDELIVRPISD